MNQLEDLLQQCTVKLTISGRNWGTGFFVAPGSILTCAHVVDGLRESPIQVMWNNQENWAQAVVVRELLKLKPYDLALLKVDLPIDANPPCVYLSGEIQSRDPLYLFGYPDKDFPNGCPATFGCEGLTGDDPQIIKFASGQVRPGMSGSPLLNQRTGNVCGIVQFTRDRSFDLGGGAMPTSVILAKFPELLEQQQSFHQQDRRWSNLDRGLGSIDLEKKRQLFGATQIQSIPKWVGRDKLLTELHTDFKNNRKVLVLHGQGGIGKTSLAVKLMGFCGVDVLSEELPIDCPYDNAFYCHVNDSATFDLATEFLKVFRIEVNRATNPAQIIDIILTRLLQEQWLVVIDNLESLMQKDSAKTKSPEVGNLLNRLAYGGHNSQIIITSRKLPEDLKHPQSKKIDVSIVKAKNINGISSADSIQLLTELGAEDIMCDLKWIANKVGGNIFVLKLLADYSRETPGILRNKPELVTEEVEPIVRAQWEKQGSLSQELLQRMCVLRIEMNETGLTTLRLLQPNGKEMKFTQEAKKATKESLADLVNCGLMEKTYKKKDCEIMYVLHPLMAETLQAIFKDDLKQLWFYAARLYGSLYLPENKDFNSIEDMRFILEKLHFDWLSETDKKSIIEIFGSKILRKLGQWYDWNLIEEWLKRILDFETELGDRAGMAGSSGSLGDIARNRGDYDKAKALYQQSLELRTELNDRAMMATCWGSLGDIARKQGNYDKAEDHYQQSLKLRTELDNREGMALSCGLLGDVARNRGDYDKAEALYQQSLRLSTERAMMATNWGCLGANELERKNLDAAETWLKKALTAMEDLKKLNGMAETNWDLAKLYRAKGDEPQAQEHYSIAHKLYTKLGAKKDLERLKSEWLSIPMSFA